MDKRTEEALVSLGSHQAVIDQLVAAHDRIAEARRSRIPGAMSDANRANRAAIEAARKLQKARS